ncbi:DUF6442 family protein [Candidatus Methanomassiliicoccus intestinalis]|uniref:DUF6442 family protein n=1 Tax=Candidatus Methanomassiliicoccus intestinalis TaxID=1406512 RepID=UPI0037DD59C1
MSKNQVIRMEKEKILELSRDENRDMDERESHIDDESAYIGLLCVLILSFAYMLFKIFINQPYMDMLSILTAGSAAMSIYKYTKIPSKKFFLVMGMILLAATIIFAICYIMEAI